MLSLSPHQLRRWERQGFVKPAETYSFTDLIALRTLHSLSRHRIRPREIVRAITELKRKLKDVDSPLTELKIACSGRTITVQLAGETMEAVTGQMLLNFNNAGPAAVAPLKRERPPKPEDLEREAERWFQRGLDIEESGAPAEHAIAAYERSVALNPAAAGSLVNLGTIYYKMRDYKRARGYYQRAVEADPKYPLAYFNLGNLYDEESDLENAQEFYKTALRLNPRYADAHFNLALLCERRGDPLKAVLHWKSYLKLDPSSSWSNIARRQLERLREATVIRAR